MYVIYDKEKSPGLLHWTYHDLCFSSYGSEAWTINKAAYNSSLMQQNCGS